MSAQPVVIAHRGYAARAPENTLSAFRLACAHHAAWIELDLQATRDGVPVVLHDTSLARTTALKARLAAVDYATVRTLDAGSWFSQEYSGEQVPRLVDVLSTVPRDVTLDIEIKPSAGRGSTGRRLCRDVLDLIDTHDRSGSAIITSFSLSVLETVRAHHAFIRLGLLGHRSVFRPSLISQLQDVQATFYFQNVLTMSRRLASRLADHGIRSGVFTANSIRAFAHARSCGVDYVITDRLEEAHAFFEI